MLSHPLKCHPQLNAIIIITRLCISHLPHPFRSYSPSHRHRPATQPNRLIAPRTWPPPRRPPLRTRTTDCAENPPPTFCPDSGAPRWRTSSCTAARATETARRDCCCCDGGRDSGRCCWRSATTRMVTMATKESVTTKSRLHLMQRQ